MSIEAIKTEAELIAALSHTGRYLEADYADDFNETNEIKLKWFVMESADGTYGGKYICPVVPEVAEKWSDETEKETSVTPWCSTHALPEFWPWKSQTP